MVTKATNSVLNLVNPPIDELVLVTPLAVSSGGIGRTSLNVGAVLIGNGVAPANLVAPAAAGQALMSNGAGNVPTFQDIAATFITGIVSVPQGGTGEVSFTVGALLAGNGTLPLYEIAPSTAGYPLLSTGSGSLPNYGNMNAAFLVGILTSDKGGTGQSNLPIGSVLIGNGTNSVLSAAPGATGLPLVSNGAGTAPLFSALNLSGTGVVTGRLPMSRAPVALLGVFSNPIVQYYTVPDFVTSIYFEVCGGGGGGAGTNTGGPNTGGGGGAGGYAAAWVTVVPGETVTITVGTGGASGPSSSTGSSNGGNGGASGIAASGGMVSATGGMGGKSGINVAGGDGGVGSVSFGGLTLYGGYGTDGQLLGSGFGGNGGASYFGGGIRGAAGGPPAGTAAPGSGGGGGYTGSSSGSIGMSGIVILRG